MSRATNKLKHRLRMAADQAAGFLTRWHRIRDDLWRAETRLNNALEHSRKLQARLDRLASFYRPLDDSDRIIALSNAVSEYELDRLRSDPAAQKAYADMIAETVIEQMITQRV